MHTAGTWDESQFDPMSWHDNHVHGLRIRAGEYGTGELEFDIDYILEWLQPTQSKCMFRVAPATLTFREVSDLHIDIDYAATTAAMTPFSIAEIRREPGNNQGPSRWTIDINWPKGQIRFMATGFRQELRGEPIITEAQVLTSHQRKALGAL